MKGQKGITLVALIITIIVMLILVAVTISIALNGGIFQKAREASEETLKAQLKEAVTLAKADALMAYYSNGATSNAETAAMNAFKPMDYLDSSVWSVSLSPASPTFGSEFTVTGTHNGTTFPAISVTVSGTAASGT